MRILAIRGKNLASLAEPFEILFNQTPLQQAGLFAITGQTGAGKSTILDALCLALYDKMPRLPDGHGFAVGHKDEDESLRVTSNDVRSILRRGASHAYAEVDFIGKDKHHYRARWEVSKARGKASGRLQPQDIILSNIASGQRMGQGKRNTLEIISELIDLNFDQFRRSVLLAQGDFAAFLKAKKDERSSLLERITGTDIYSELSIAAFERARQEKDALNQLVGLLQNQIPLDNDTRIELEQQRDQLSRQLTELDMQITDNQKIIYWYVELAKRRHAQQQAIEAHASHQQNWDAAEGERLLIQKVEAVQPLRPLVSHYKTAKDDYLEAENSLKISDELRTAAESALQTSKQQLTILYDQLQAAEQQQQQALPMLKAARDLDTRLDIVQNTINALTAEELHLNKALETAQQRHESLLKQQADKASSQEQIKGWLEQNQAFKALAAEWNRWEGELERYQTVKVQQTARSLQAEQTKILLKNDELALAEIKTAIESNQKQLEQQQTDLEQLKRQGGQNPLEALYQEKDVVEYSVKALTRALALANQALELQQIIKRDADSLAATEQLITESNQQLQRITQQMSVNECALDEAKRALDLIKAATHKNAGEFRRLLIEGQPCPVCGALEHPWQTHVSSNQEVSTAQQDRVNELQSRKEALIENNAEFNKTITFALESQRTHASSLHHAQAILASLDDEWNVIALQDKPEFPLTDVRLLPLLNTRHEQWVSALELIKCREKAALELQKKLITAQEMYDATKLKMEKLTSEYAGLDKLQAKHKADLENITINVQQQHKQLNEITDVLRTPFQYLENWQDYLRGSHEQLKEKVQNFQQTEQELMKVSTSLNEISHDEKLAQQTLEQSLQQYRDKQTQIRSKTEERQMLSTERNALLPGFVSGMPQSADSFEKNINEKAKSARAAHQHVSDVITQQEKELAGFQQQQQHWQIETSRRLDNRDNSLASINLALAKQAINLEQLSELLKHDEEWLSEQKQKTQELERTLHESSALLKVKAEEYRQHESHAVEISEQVANQRAIELQLQKNNLSSKREEQILLLREDDKKIAASSHLKVELEIQQNRWHQWESLNELIGSSNGAKFRVFAQSLTLEALLAHSNRHLEDFAKRYHLQRVPDSDLELQIIDRDMADDVRSVHSLSGGESFLVSLALALGLASLSSNKTQVESLFIDEGFGTLDPETLDIAIASLDTLQALGRKVGVISHVPILVERIGAKVVVEKQGGGRSSVVIVGGY